MIKVSASLLAAPQLSILDCVGRMEKAQVDLLHVDVMDGHFVPNMSFGPEVVRQLKGHTNIPLDVHLMISDPARYMEEFIKAGADYLTIHLEADSPVGDTLAAIRDLGAKCGISIKPQTAAEALFPYLDDLDLVLVMSVEPGFGGQKLIPHTVEKLAVLRRELTLRGGKALLSIDGGVNERNAPDIVEAGADILVLGSALIGAQDPAAVVSALHDIV